MVGHGIHAVTCSIYTSSDHDAHHKSTNLQGDATHLFHVEFGFIGYIDILIIKGSCGPWRNKLTDRHTSTWRFNMIQL